ncbi:MAG TPA: response regulator [Actinomycetota bacterium]|nr:response regulator [Actinomycetota bacterium]
MSAAARGTAAPPESLAPRPSRLPRILTWPETWGLGFTGLLLWLFAVEGAHAALGDGAILMWVPVAIGGVIFNLQVRRLGSRWPDVAGGTPNYVTRLLQPQPALARYAGLAYFQGWASVPALSGILLAQMVGASLSAAGVQAPVRTLTVAFTALAFVVAFSGGRTLSVLHLFFLVPAVGLLLVFCVQGLGWAAADPATRSRGLAVTGLNPQDWAKWFFVAAYGAYGCDTASSFVADSRDRGRTLTAIKAAAVFLPVVYVGGSWVVNAFGPASAPPGAFQGFLTVVAAPFWGGAAPPLVTFLLASSILLSCATAAANCPRMLYQFSRDGLMAPVLSVVSPSGVLGPALTMTLAVSLAFLVWGDVTSALVVSATGYFVSCILMHAGIWLRRDQPGMPWPRLSLALAVLEAVTLVIGGLRWGWAPFALGLLVPAAMAGLDTLIRRLRLAVLDPDWWARQHARRAAATGEDPVMFQVLAQLILLSVAGSAGWLVGGAALRQATATFRTNLFVMFIVIVGFVGVAVASWTTLARLHRVQSSQRRMRHLLESAVDGVTVVDAAGLVTVANEASGKIFGTATTNLSGRPLVELLPDMPPDPRAWPSHSERQIDLPGQLQKCVDVTISQSETETLVEYMVVLRDITESRQMEKMKDEFTSVVSHELRTPLTSIRGALGLLSQTEGSLSGSGQRMLSIALSNTERLVRLINDILDVQRLESGRVEMKPQVRKAADLIKEAAEAMKAMADGAGVHLEARPGDERVWADADRILQVLTNLISNAIKFSPEGARVTVESASINGEVVFRVTDSGRGIPHDKLESIFERFRQVDSTDSREREGTGLGLAISRGIVEQHGGRIWVESTVGEGSTFLFSLPSVSDPGPDDGDGEEAATVLVCDDDPAVADVVATILRREGYAVLVATSGEEALDKAAEHNPQAVILDLLMPGMSGWQTAAALKAQPSTSTIPIIILSALSQDEAAEVPGDVAGWLAKPVEEAKLFEGLRGALSAGAARVLVVEDQPRLSSVIETTLRDAGAETATATSGREALGLLETLQPDMIVLDLALGDDDALDVADWVKEHPNPPALVAVDSSATTADPEGEAAEPAGRFLERLLGLLERMTRHSRRGSS